MHRSLSGGTFHFDDPEGRLTDPDRLRRVRETGLMDGGSDGALDRLTGLAAGITGHGFAAVCLVEAARQTFPSAVGLPGSLAVDRQLPLSHSFSKHVVANDAAMVVADAREHPVLRLNPSVEGHGVVAYAGYPLHDPDGVVLGAVCMIEPTPRDWSVEQLELLGDVTARVETEIALRVRTRHALLCQERMQHVIDGVVDTAVLAADARGVVTVMNDGAEKMLAQPAAGVIGTQSLSHVLRTAQPLGPEPGEGQARDWLLVDGAGRTKVVSIRSSVLRDSSGSLDGYILVADDVSSRRETETLLREAVRNQREAIERLTDLDRARNVFIATASHELRTPVSSILGYTELLLEGAAGPLSPAQLELLHRVDGNSKRLFALVEELLDLARLDARTPAAVRASMDANTPARHAWEAVQPDLAERDLRAHLEVCDSAPRIVGDAAQVERALLHLLQNAVKFTPDGGTVRLTVRAAADGAEYEVADTGIGIAEAEQASVFDPFFRTQHAHSLAIPGAGIGLSIVRRIVEAHRGQVQVTSGSGDGTTVVVALAAGTQVSAQVPADLPAGAEDRVLLGEEPPDRAMSDRGLESELREALEGRVPQLVLRYQPIVDLASGAVVAVDSRLHWLHPVRGLLGAEQIFPVAESAGLLQELGDWVLDRAVVDAVSLTHREGELDVVVGLFAPQLDDRTVATVRRALDRSGLRPGRLVLEVTESALVEREETTAATYVALSQLGVRIAVADFGTGYSSLLHLRRNPVSALTIDRSFVAGIGESADDEAMCESIIALAAAAGATSVGAGVATLTQYAVLRSLGCQRGQGSLWSLAVPVGELDAAFAACDEVPVVAPRSRMSPPPERLPDEVTATIAEMHSGGASRHTIAAALNRRFGPHPNGVRWTAGAVARELPVADGPSARVPSRG